MNPSTKPPILIAEADKNDQFLLTLAFEDTFNIEWFTTIPLNEKLDWYNQAHQGRCANRRIHELSEIELRSCIWYGQLLLEGGCHYPPQSFEECLDFLALHTWLLRVKQEWLNRVLSTKFTSSLAFMDSYENSL